MDDCLQGFFRKGSGEGLPVTAQTYPIVGARSVHAQELSVSVVFLIVASCCFSVMF